MGQVLRSDRRKSAATRGYDRRWRKARKAFLARHPLCAMCEAQGRLTQATVVDHIVPHQGNRSLFWDRDNWQPLCDNHHASAKQREEVRGYSNAVGPNGWPSDPRHPANRGDRGSQN